MHHKSAWTRFVLLQAIHVINPYNRTVETNITVDQAGNPLTGSNSSLGRVWNDAVYVQVPGGGGGRPPGGVGGGGGGPTPPPPPFPLPPCKSRLVEWRVVNTMLPPSQYLKILDF